MGFAQLGGGCYEGAVAWLSRSIGLNRGHPTPHCLLAAALASLGRIEEAREAAQQGLDLSPSFTIARYRSSGFSRNPRLYRRPRAHVRGHAPGGDPRTMTAAHRLAAILAADVGVGEHRDGGFEYHANGSFTPGNRPRASGGCEAARGGRGPMGTNF